QPFFCLAGCCCCGLNSLLSSLMLSESRGHSQENEFLAQFAALMRAACLTGLATGTGTFSNSDSGDPGCAVRSETCCTSWVCGAGGGSGCCLAISAAAM